MSSFSSQRRASSRAGEPEPVGQVARAWDNMPGGIDFGRGCRVEQILVGGCHAVLFLVGMRQDVPGKSESYGQTRTYFQLSLA